MARTREDGNPLSGFRRASILQLRQKVIAGNMHLPGALLPLHTVNSLM